MTKRSDFENFIRTLLVRGKLKEKHIATLTSKENLKEFQICFTHKSADPVRNYETYEWYGDVIINEFVCYYLRERYPDITNVGWLSKIKGKMASGKILGTLAMKEFEKFAIYGEEIAHFRNHPELDEENKYVKMFEDFVEALCGCIVITMEKEGFRHGTAVEICHNFLRTFYADLPISSKYEDVFDAVSRLKELYENKARNLRWPNNKVYEFEKKEGDNPMWWVKVFGWPLGDRTPIFRNRVELAYVGAINKDEAKQLGAKAALDVLFNQYGIQDLRPTSKVLNK